MATTLRENGIQMGDSIMDVQGSAPSSTVRAWIKFDGSTNPPTIRESRNISSITRLGDGWYRINFTTNMHRTFPPLSYNYTTVINTNAARLTQPGTTNLSSDWSSAHSTGFEGESSFIVETYRGFTTGVGFARADIFSYISVVCVS